MSEQQVIEELFPELAIQQLLTPPPKTYTEEEVEQLFNQKLEKLSPGTYKFDDEIVEIS